MKPLLSISSLLSLLAAVTLVPTSFAQQQRSGREFRERGEGMGAVLPIRQGEGVQEAALRGGEFTLAAPPQRAGRMTPEERRQLRRDIDDAGREIYRHRHGRP